MKYICFFILASWCTTSKVEAQPITKFQGGKVLTYDAEGKGAFVSQDFYVLDSVIRFEVTQPPDTTIDITDRYVIPPFGDAHTHNLDREWQRAFLPEQYLAEGTFYVLNLTSKAQEVEKLRPYYDQPNTPDVRFALQGWTSELGHPFLAYEPFAMGLNDPSVWQDSMAAIKNSRLDEGNSYLFANTVEEAQTKMADFFAQQPDVVKIYLVDSERYDENSADTIAGNNGLSKEVAQYITDEAHRHNLPVFAHITNGTDFALATKIGVDCVAHVPTIGWNGEDSTKSLYVIPDFLMEEAIDQNIAVITTLQWTYDVDSLRQQRKLALATDFLQRYHQLGGTILIGSDRFGETLVPEIQALITSQVFDPATLLRIVSSTTPRYIFPERNIGQIKDHCEADFLLLAKDPLENSEALLHIQEGYKAGKRAGD